LGKSEGKQESEQKCSRLPEENDIRSVTEEDGSRAKSEMGQGKGGKEDGVDVFWLPVTLTCTVSVQRKGPLSMREKGVVL
jgi:hypothetical protein